MPSDYLPASTIIAICAMRTSELKTLTHLIPPVIGKSLSLNENASQRLLGSILLSNDS